MHKAFPLLVRKSPLPEGTSHLLKKNATARRKVLPLVEVCTAIIVKEKSSVKDDIIEFGDSYKVPTTTDPNNTTTRKDDEQAGRTVTITTEDMQRKKNDVKARTTLLLSLPDEHQLRFSKYKTAKELWAAILKKFGEAEKDDLNQKFLTSLAPEWLMHTIVWRNRNDLDTMSLDDLYNHLKVYEAEVQKKSNPNSQNMAFISSSKHSSGDEDDIASAYIASQSNGSQIKFENINHIDEDDMEEMDIKWSMALLSMRADKFWKRTGKKIRIQGSDVVGFDKSKVECFNCHKMSHFARECRAPRSQERGRKENYRQGSKTEEKTPKALMAIDGVGWDWSYMENKGEDHPLVADAEALTEFALMANSESKELETLKLEKDGLDRKLACLLKASKKLDNLIESQRPSPTVASTSAEGQNKNSTTFLDVASPNTPKPFVKFVKPKDSQSENHMGAL
uniref:CCHC-type domain-containing protein n=1 Tax=Tanacetum cinerariifolium TaxID=118510 RepID=A0A6L2P519_TANCI|nr:hypothetical protein [Tanacetum cinerariifolium]